MEYNKEELLKLYNSCKKMIYNIAFKYSNSKYDNEDLMQQAYLIMVDTLKTFDKNRGVKFTTYFYKILDMKLYDYANSKCSYIRVPTYFYNRKKIIKDYIITPFIYCSIILLSVDKICRRNDTFILLSGLLASICHALTLSGTLTYVIINSLNTFLIFVILSIMYRKSNNIWFSIILYGLYLMSNLLILKYIGW